MSGLRTLLEAALSEAKVGLLLARAIPENGIVSRELAIREAEAYLLKTEKMLAANNKPAVLRFRAPKRKPA